MSCPLRIGRLFTLGAGLFAATLTAPARGDDWPMWRYDANRSAAAPHDLPDRLHLQWVRHYPPLTPAWEDPVNQDRMPFDRVYEPVTLGSTMFIGSNRNDAMVALDTRTGKEKWRIHAGGPVRLPPVADDGAVYFASDDGYLYCVSTETGALIWRFRGGPGNRKVLGNSRLVSAWPARGGPVICDGIVYFAASIWPFMGTFIHALDAKTGEVVWTNDGLGAEYINQPHGGSVSFGGVAPQGAIAAIGDKLVLPSGRSVPACLDRATGELLYYHLSGSSHHLIGGGGDRKREGGSLVAGVGDFYLNHRGLNTSIYDLDTGGMYMMWRTTTYPVLTADVCYFSGNPVIARGLKTFAKIGVDRQVKDKKTGKEQTVTDHHWEVKTLWECQVDGTGALIKAGKRLYAGGKNVVSALDLVTGAPPTLAWTATVDGTVARIIAADERLFVVTLEGRIYAFGAAEVESENLHRTDAVSTPRAEARSQADAILQATGVRTGYCFVYGLGPVGLVEELAVRSKLHVIAVDTDANKIDALRRRLDAIGLYGSRVSAHVGDAMTFEAPPYAAALTVVQDGETARVATDPTALRNVYRGMRPYGGVACLPVTDRSRRAAVAGLVRSAGLEKCALTTAGKYLLIHRQGALPGSGDWTHQNGNIANTTKSDDKLVRLPLGLLWFGGNTHHDILPRHAHGPPEQVIGGRLFIEGVDRLSARDVYTGQVLWQRTGDDLGTAGVYYDSTYNPDPLDTTYNQVHIPGANARGTNYVATADKVYLLTRSTCLVLDPATGETIAVFELPAADGAEAKPAWGYIGVYEDLLIAGASFVRFSQEYGLAGTSGGGGYGWNSFDVTSSRRLVVMDRHTGEARWTRGAQSAFRHNAIAVGAGKLFCIDATPQPVVEALKRRGETPDLEPVLLALDVETGAELWRETERVFGTWLAYSQEHDVLLQSGRSSRDTIPEPTSRIATFRGRDGTVLWDKPVSHGGPCMIHGRTVYFNAVSSAGTAVSLLTGEPKTRRHPVTGVTVPWQYQRRYGCNYVVASENLLTFRSGAAGYYDLLTDSGTGNLGGFKSGCTSNLIAANGVLNAPDYTRTCTCSYQNQTSLALVYMPDVEMWTFNQLGGGGETAAPVRRLGLNLGAPGDRVAADGTLWLDCPSVGGPSPDVAVEFAPDSLRWFRHHSSRIVDGSLPWVAASGVQGVERIKVTLVTTAAENGEEAATAPAPPEPYTVRLYFAEPDDMAPGQRLLGVSLQGRQVLSDFDIVKAAGGPHRTVVKTFDNVAAGTHIELTLTPKAGRSLLCGIEIIADGW